MNPTTNNPTVSRMIIVAIAPAFPFMISPIHFLVL